MTGTRTKAVTRFAWAAALCCFSAASSSYAQTPGVGALASYAAIDAAGNKYVLSLVNANGLALETQKLSPQGQLVWAVDFTSGEALSPAGITVDKSGNVYAAGNDLGEAASFILEYGPDGAFISSQTAPYQGTPYFPQLTGIIFGPVAGALYAAQTFVDPAHGGLTSALVMAYDSNLKLTRSQTVNDGPGTGDESAGIAADASGNVYIGLLQRFAGGGSVAFQAVEWSPDLNALISRQSPDSLAPDIAALLNLPKDVAAPQGPLSVSFQGSCPGSSSFTTALGVEDFPDNYFSDNAPNPYTNPRPAA